MGAQSGHSAFLPAASGRLDWPGGSPDLIEYGRGVLAAHTHVSNEQAREVHILRLRNAFDRAGFAHALRYVLRVLALMREVQELKGGYWFPTPTRVVPLERTALLVAPITTLELQRHFAVSRAGYARCLISADKTDLPKQSLQDWAGFEVSDTATWTRQVLRQAAATMGSTIQSENIEFFGIRQSGRDKSTRAIGTWFTDVRSALVTGMKVVLCRSRLTDTFHRYFLGLVEKGRLVQETEAPQQVDRLQHGMATLAGRPLTVEVAIDDFASTFCIFSGIPRPERRLMMAVGNRTAGRWEKAFRVESEEHSTLVATALKNLGCELKPTNAR